MMPARPSESRPDDADVEWVRAYHERLKQISVVDALDGVPPFPRLPTNIDDPVALDNWAAAWNAWIATESVVLQRPLLKKMTPATLAAIVRGEKRARAHEANSNQQQELAEARSALNALEGRLRATDPVYNAKRALLVPILKPIFGRLPPRQWVAAFQEAYSQADIPTGGRASNLQQGTMSAAQKRVRTAVLAATNLLLIGAAYAVGAWIISEVNTSLSFPAAVAAAIGIMVLFETLNAIRLALLWFLGARTRAVDEWLHFLQQNEFPAQRRYRHDDVANYLTRIENDGTLTPRVRMAAREMQIRLSTLEGTGIFISMRMRSAATTALEAHAPRKNAPEFTA